MALQNASIPIGATYTPAGGTATTFSPDGVEVKGGLHQSDPTATDMHPEVTDLSESPGATGSGDWRMDQGETVTHLRLPQNPGFRKDDFSASAFGSGSTP